MVVVSAVTVAVVVALVPDVGLSPSVKAVAAPVVAAAVVAAGAEVVVAAPRGLSMKARPPPAAVVDAATVLAAEVGATLKVKPVPVAVAVGAADVGIGAAKRDGPKAETAWVDTGGAGVDEGLIPKANPPP